MTFTRRTILALTAATALAGGLPALAADLPEGGTVAAVENTKGPLKIAFMAFQNNPFWVPVTDGAKAAAAYLKDHDTQVDYVDLGDNLNAEAVISGIESAVAQKYDGIVIVPIFDGTERAINEATAAGVPVFNIIAEGRCPPTGSPSSGRTRRRRASSSARSSPRSSTARARSGSSPATSVPCSTTSG